MSIAPPPVAVPVEAPDAAAYRAPATDLLAMLAIGASVAGVTVVPLLGSLAGIVLGAISIVRIRRTHGGGAALAISAIVLGAVGAVAIVAAVVAFGAALASIVGSAPPLP